jgi:hypothetical protein
LSCDPVSGAAAVLGVLVGLADAGVPPVAEVAAGVLEQAASSSVAVTAHDVPISKRMMVSPGSGSSSK